MDKLRLSSVHKFSKNIVETQFLKTSIYLMFFEKMFTYSVYPFIDSKSTRIYVYELFFNGPLNNIYLIVQIN